MIEFRMRTAGYAGERIPFTPDALYELYQYTGATRALSAR